MATEQPSLSGARSTPPIPTPPPPSIADTLSMGVLSLIFDEVLCSVANDSEGFKVRPHRYDDSQHRQFNDPFPIILRLVSRIWNVAATPYAYQFMRVGKLLTTSAGTLSVRDKRLRRAIYANIHQYTKYVQITQEDVFEWGKTSSVDEEEGLRFLTASTQLVYLNLQVDNNAPFRFISQKQKFPGIKNLRFDSYPWSHYSNADAAIWDFSQLESLSMNCGMADLVIFYALSTLTELRLTDFNRRSKWGLTIEDIILLQGAGLRAIELELKIPNRRRDDFIDVLATFQDLQFLIVYLLSEKSERELSPAVVETDILEIAQQV
ncbi:hypothetical protein G7Y89_g6943 [Cudoniella acicularis]|uniref:Uncharacterized protein n=1 Tax=Cudoniella acicularis TaxID=354080 RepID=A0A8H4W4A1_9HELO|nr:hypothetical protein G7Y89_g6943 [Cudoniella acicularis]